MKRSIRHMVQLLAVMCVVGSIHLFTILSVDYIFNTKLLFILYVVNALLACLGYIAIRLMFALKTQAEGFAFLLGSFIKLGVLYALFLSNDFLTSGNPKEVFIHVFIPYAISLIWEIKVLATVLNAPQKTTS